MPKAKNPHFGGLPPMYEFILNPYPDMRLSSCPFCRGKTGQRTVPLFIHVAPLHPVTMNYTCRYCRHCDLLMVHKHEVEHLLHHVMRQVAPEVIGNKYVVMGTVDKQAWREDAKQPKSIDALRPHIHDFKRHHPELRMTRPGWYPKDQEPPPLEPPKSKEWIKEEGNPVKMP